MDNKVYESLKKFWDDNFKITEDDIKKIKEEIDPINDLNNLAPSIKQKEALNYFKNSKNVLDYGAGHGWASILMAKNGAKVTAVDVSKNSIIMLKAYADAFNVLDNINAFSIDKDWLKNEKDESYDGFFSSNVIDVIPLDMAKEIIKESARIVKKDSIVIYSLNYYANPKDMESGGCIVDGCHIFMEGILRLTSLMDSEWIDIFKEYYEIINLSYFSWEGEKEERRRLFILKRK